MCLLYGVCRCIDLNTTYYRCISCSFTNNSTNVVFTLKGDFVLEGWDIAYYARVYYCYYYYFNAWHSLLQCSFMQPLWKKNCNSDLPGYVKIATSTALSASALRPGVFLVSCATALSIWKIAPCIICAGTRLCLSRHASQGASLMAQV